MDRTEYDKIPVLFCRHCLSLKVRGIPDLEDSDYCDECGSTSIGECSIEHWKELYKERYGHDYVTCSKIRSINL